MGENFESEREVNLYFDGVREGLQRFAWWKDGEQQVGTCGYTLAKALSECEDERRSQHHFLMQTGVEE